MLRWRSWQAAERKTSSPVSLTDARPLPDATAKRRTSPQAAGTEFIPKLILAEGNPAFLSPQM